MSEKNTEELSEYKAGNTSYPYQAKNQSVFYNPLFKKDCSLFHALERYQ